MKKSILRVLALALVAAMLFACTSCTQTILVRFVDGSGNDINFGSSSPVSNGSSYVPATQAPATQAPATQAPATQSSGDATTAAPAGDTPTEAPAGDTPTEAPAGDTPTAAPANKVPSTPAEIADFYKAAVNKVKNNAAAGYTKKEWQTISNLNITGNGTVDKKIGEIVGGYMTTEDQAGDQVSEKGSDDSKNRFPSFTADYNNIAQAACTVNANGNYEITIVSIVEDTPKKEGSIMSTFTNSFLAWEDITTEIDNNVSIVKDYKDSTHLYYTVTITAEITPDGNFVYMQHFTGCDIKIDSAKILIVTLKNKQAHLDNICKYTAFSY